MSKTKITTIFIILLTGVCFAQATDYIPLEPLPGTSPDQPTTLPDYLSKLIPIIISVAGILAVVIIVIAGLQYITAAGNTSQIASAKSRIWSALGGLLLLISSYLILNTINPDLIKLDLSISPIDVGAPATGGGEILTSEEIEIMCTAQCGASGYEYNVSTNSCSCFGMGTHKECQLVAGLQPNENSYQCVTVNFSGTDTCTDNSSCMQQLNCCICDYYVTDNCTSGISVTEEGCENQCHSSLVPWRYFYTSSAICDANDNCIAQ